MVKTFLAAVPVWTPSGTEYWSGYVRLGKEKDVGDVAPNLTSLSQPGEIAYARRSAGFLPSPGLRYQAVATLAKDRRERFVDGFARDLAVQSFVSDIAEDSSTVLKFLRIGAKYADGLVIQYPVVNADGTDFERDEKGIPKGRQTWQMALPIKHHPVSAMGDEFDPFLNTMFGMEGARKMIRDSGFGMVVVEPVGERRVICSPWYGPPDIERLNSLGCVKEPFVQSDQIGFRLFEGGEGFIIDQERKKRYVVEAAPEEAERYASLMREHGIPFREEP